MRTHETFAGARSKLLVGGWVSGMFGGPGVSGFNLTSILVAAGGAIIVLFVYGLIARRR